MSPVHKGRVHELDNPVHTIPRAKLPCFTVLLRGGTKKGLVYDLALDSTGTWAVAAVQGGTLLVFDVSTGKQVSSCILALNARNWVAAAAVVQGGELL
eukprot:1149558-Pelagomonas_calceolata.AAC.2